MNHSLKNLRQACTELQFRYREERKEFMTEDVHREAYFHYRLPATTKALSYVLAEYKKWLPHEIHSVMDVGAGHSGAVPTLRAAFPALQKVLLLEKDRGFTGDYIYEDVRHYTFDQPLDLFLFSYILNELSLEESLNVLTKAFVAASKSLIIIEPGSQGGFQKILAYRQHLIDLGGSVVAPCPHQGKCPLSWCHFSVRVQRTALHREVKNASLNYEDEKFCYLIVTKEKLAHSYGRVVEKVDPKSKMVILPLCTKNGFEKPTFTKKKHQNFPQLKKARWGDSVVL